MTKKHFESMARYINMHVKMTNLDGPGMRLNAAAAKARVEASKAFVRGMYNLAVHMGRSYNPRFDEARFREACAIPDGWL